MPAGFSQKKPKDFEGYSHLPEKAEVTSFWFFFVHFSLGISRWDSAVPTQMPVF